MSGNANNRQTPKKKRGITEHPFFVFMGKVGDVFAVGLLWLVCCVPVVTVGAATVGLFTVTQKLVRGEDVFAARDFFKAFRRDFGTATRLWLPLLGFGALLIADFAIAGRTSGVFAGVLAAAAFVFVCLWCCAAGWGFALLARFAYTRARDVLRDALQLSAANLLPSCLAVFLLLWQPALAMWWPEALVYLLPALLLIGGGATAAALSAAQRPAFDKIEANKTK